MKTLILILMLGLLSCSADDTGGDKPPVKPDPDPPAAESEVRFFLTLGDQSKKFQEQTDILVFGTSHNNYASIKVNPSETFQTVEGFGYTLTGGSAEVINSLSSGKRQELLQRLFGKGEEGNGISYLRLSVGASDLSSEVFSYNDLPEGQTDEDLSEFSLEPDMKDLIPLLLDILEISPDIRLMATPWSPPAWMKDNNSSIGGSLKPEYYQVYAKYLVKYLQEMEALGIEIHAMTPQNEPLHPGNNPSMSMTAPQQAEFIKTALGPAFKAAGIDTDIIIYDHNADKPEYPLAVLSDPQARQYIAGSAFHLYAGDISALSQVHNAFPDKGIYFTEQYTASNGDFGGDLRWHLKNVIIGSMRNWSKTALEWNLANDPNFGPHTPGGCTTCKGAVTVKSSSSYDLNVGFYIIAHASKFVTPGSVRIGSNSSGSLHNVAFRTSEGKKILLVLNDGNSFAGFNVEYNGKWFATGLASGAVGTYIWD